MIGVIALAMICLLYLDVTSQAAIVGREIQDLQAATIKAQHRNADLQTRLAVLLSTDSMESRALARGFRPAEAGEIHYLVVPGYVRPYGSQPGCLPHNGDGALHTTGIHAIPAGVDLRLS